MDLSDYGPKLTARAYLEIDFGERIKAELDAGEIKPVERGPIARVRIAGNVQVFISNHVRGTGRYAHGSMLALMTSKRSVRYPDVAVYDHNEAAYSCDDRDLMANPLVVVHILSDYDRADRLAHEYWHVPTLRSVLLIDYKRERVRALTRGLDGGWNDVDHAEAADIAIPALNFTIPHSVIFSRA